MDHPNDLARAFRRTKEGGGGVGGERIGPR